MNKNTVPVLNTGEFVIQPPSGSPFLGSIIWNKKLEYEFPISNSFTESCTLGEDKRTEEQKLEHSLQKYFEEDED